MSEPAAPDKVFEPAPIIPGKLWASAGMAANVLMPQAVTTIRYRKCRMAEAFLST